VSHWYGLYCLTVTVSHWSGSYSLTPHPLSWPGRVVGSAFSWNPATQWVSETVAKMWLLWF